jgi:hypothetical protein
VLVLLAVNRTYMEPYTSPLGQVLLAVLLSAYVATLLWMRQMTAGRPAPRFLTSGSGPGALAAGPPALRVRTVGTR